MKTELRARMRAARLALPEGERANLSARIQENAWPLVAKAGRVLLYAHNFGEVETDELARRLLAQGAAVYYPRTLGRGRMEAVRVWGPQDLRPGRMGILEPTGGELAEELDAVLVPGLAFSREGARLGFGAGYYDRFLAGRSGRFVGLAYAFQVVTGLALEPHDVPVHEIVTEQGICHCKKREERE